LDTDIDGTLAVTYNVQIEDGDVFVFTCQGCVPLKPLNQSSGISNGAGSASFGSGATNSGSNAFGSSSSDISGMSSSTDNGDPQRALFLSSLHQKSTAELMTMSNALLLPILILLLYEYR
jgi:hypothetical protein